MFQLRRVEVDLARFVWLVLCSLLCLVVPVSGQPDLSVRSGNVFQEVAEVTSVKPSKPGMLLSITPTPNGYSAKGISVRVLLCGAYNVVICSSISGLPGWADSARYDIEAKFDEHSANAIQKLAEREQWQQRRVVLQALLADRFKLKIHHEAREALVYSLVVAKSGSKLMQSSSNEPEAMMVGSSRIIATATTIDDLVRSLSDRVGRVVIDSTGLMQKYDFKLTASTGFEEGTSDSDPSIFAALQEQLGLKLVPSKAPVDTVVVDHIEKPAAN